jgi:hypothetical protein
MSENERFLARWSRLKRTEASAQPADRPPAVPSPADASAPLPPLPPIGELTIDSDYAGFFHPKVDEKLRRAALRKLFTDPRFNVMDGLDVYTGDYSRNDPLPAAMLAQLEQGKKILAWAREDTEKSAAEDAAAASPPAQVGEPLTQIPSAAPPVVTGTVGESRDVAPSASPSRGS